MPTSASTRSGVTRFLLGPRVWWQEAIALFVVYEVYTLIRAHLPEPAGPAFEHAEQLIRVEQALGIFHEATIQSWMLGSRLVIQLWNLYYATIHFVVPVVVLVLLWRRDRDRYRLWRNAFGIMLVSGLVGFTLWPLAPPRLMPASEGFVDTEASYGGLGPLGRGDRKDTNQFAAMPSLHAGWSTWCAFALYPVLRRRWSRVLLVAYPVATLVAIVVTGNHFLLDAPGGWAALAIGVAVASLVERRSGRALTTGVS